MELFSRRVQRLNTLTPVPRAASCSPSMPAVAPAMYRQQSTAAQRIICHYFCHYVHFQCFEDGSGEGAGARGSPSRPRRSGARVSHAGCLASSLPSPLIMLLSLCRNIRLPIRTRLGRRRPDMLTPWRWRAKRAFAAGAAGTRPTCASAASRSSAGTESFGTPARIPATGA